MLCVCVCGEAKSPSRCVLCCGREGGGIGKRPTYPPCCVRTCAVPGSVRATNQQPPFFPSTSSSPSSISLSLLLIPYSRLPFAAAAKSSRRRRRRRKKTGAKERLKQRRNAPTRTRSPVRSWRRFSLILLLLNRRLPFILQSLLLRNSLRGIG